MGTSSALQVINANELAHDDSALHIQISTMWVMCIGLCLDLYVTAHSLGCNKSSLAQLAPSGTRHLSLHDGPLAWVTWNVFLEDLSFTPDKQLSARHLLVPP